jgi:hypothetical protein
MKPKMGRPKLPKSEVKGILLGAKFAPDEAKSIAAAVKRENTDKSKWIRKTLLSAAGGVRV